MKTLHHTLGAAVVSLAGVCTQAFGAATGYEGSVEFWLNTSSNVVPFSIGLEMRARPGVAAFLSPNIAWNGESMAFPGLLPADSSSRSGIFFSNQTYTNNPALGEFLGFNFATVQPEGLRGGATNITTEPLPMYAEFAAAFTSPCPPTPPLSTLFSAASQGDKDCLDCPDGDCTEAVREKIEDIVKELRKAKLLDEAFLLEQMLEKGHFVVDTDGTKTSGECGIAFGKPLATDSTPTMFISPDILCKTNAAEQIAFMAGLCSVQWENPVLRRNDDDVSTEASVMILLAALIKADEQGKRLLDDLKKYFEALKKPIMIAEANFPITACMIDALCKAINYKGARSDEAEQQARELRQILQKIRGLIKDFEKLSRAQQEALVQGMISRMNAIIIAIKTRNWAMLEALGVPRGCIDPRLMSLADAWKISTAGLPGKTDIGRTDRNQSQDIVVPIENENTVLVFPGEEDFRFGAPVPVPVSGGPHAVVMLYEKEPAQVEVPNLSLVAVATRRNGLFVIRRDDAGNVAVPLSSPSEISLLCAPDVNGDGLRDIVAIGGPSNAPAIVTHIRSPQASSQFEMKPNEPYFSGGVAVAVGDWNGDGNEDIVVARPGFLDFIHVPAPVVQDGIPWEAPRTLPGVPQPIDLQALDIDGNHRIDFAVADAASPLVQVWLNDSPAGPRLANTISFPEPITAIAIGDLDGDGIPDILAGMGESPRLALQMNPAWTPPPAERQGTPETLFIDLLAPATQLLLRDLDGDFDRDLTVVTAGGVEIFQRLFSTPIVECAFRVPIVSLSGDTLILEHADIDPTLVRGPFRLLYRNAWEDEWRPVPPDDVLSHTGNRWILRRPGTSFRLFRIAAE